MRSGSACTGNFTEPELVELGCMIGLTLGQQSWLRLLNIEHHQVLAGTDASMAPGFESMDKLQMTKAQADYWAKQSPARWLDRDGTYGGDHAGLYPGDASMLDSSAAC